MAEMENGIELDVRHRNNNIEQDANSNTYLAKKSPLHDLYEPDPLDSEQAKQNENQEGYSPVAASCVAYAGAACCYLFGFNVPELPKLPSPLIGNVLPESLQNYYKEVVVVPLIMWGFHYARRFAEVLFVHIYKRRMPTHEAIGASVYYWFFGLWIGWAMNFQLGYRTPHPGFFYIGLILFIIGEIGNCYSHIKLRTLRLKSSTKPHVTLTRNSRELPTGFLFDYIDCPHYMFEIVTWIGFSLCSFTAAAFIFLLATICTLVVRAKKYHDDYEDYFNGVDDRPKYPENRKALIPFIF